MTEGRCPASTASGCCLRYDRGHVGSKRAGQASLPEVRKPDGAGSDFPEDGRLSGTAELSLHGLRRGRDGGARQSGGPCRIAMITTFSLWLSKIGSTDPTEPKLPRLLRSGCDGVIPPTGSNLILLMHLRSGRSIRWDLSRLPIGSVLQNKRAAHSQRPPRPSEMQRGGMTVPDRLLLRRGSADRLK